MANIDEPAPLRSRHDILEFYRNRIMYVIAIMVFLFVTPFSILNLVQGNYLLSLAFAAVVATFSINGVALHLKHDPPIPFIYLLLPGFVTIAISLVYEGLPGALGCFPGILVAFFVLPRRVAVICGIAMLAVAAPVMIYTQGVDMAMRFVASLTLTIAVIYVIIDVIRELQNDLMDQVVTDPLTGAYNRRQMEFVLGEAIERHQRNNTPASVLMIDIDHFKRINDEHGHDSGDQVLKGLVKLIKNRSRKLDRLFRIGGEEFLLFLADTPAPAAVKQAESLRGRISESTLLKQRPVTVSIGVAEYHRDLKALEDWIKIADNALYKAKESGRNRVFSGHDLDGAPPPPTSTDTGADGRRARER